MHRIDSNGSVDGAFQDGNPAIGQQATQLTADWFNAVQEELAHVVEQAGIPLDKPDNAQLYAAIIALIAGVVGDGSGAVPTTRLVSTAGLATGGGDLAANRTITVPKASQAEASAGVDDTKALTSYAAAGLVGLTVTGGAWIIKIGPVIVQLFTGSVGGNGTTILTLPQAYVTECKMAFCNGGAIDADAQDNGPYVSGTGLTTVSVFSARDGSTVTNVIAFGR